VYFSKSSSNVAASEIQNLKNSLDFSKMQKFAANFSRLFLVRSASFFQKQRFSRKIPSFFDEILEKLGSRASFSGRHLWWVPQRGDPRENLQKWSNFGEIASRNFA
jgi:hypothetical protein